MAVELARILYEILAAAPRDLALSPEWLCERHRTLAGGLFPDWAGRYRDVDVSVESHTPPNFYEVPSLVRLFCEDLAKRLRHVGAGEGDIGRFAELLAWADWRFQWIHPFKDFNGRQYLDALQRADGGDLGPLTAIWVQRIADAL